MFIHGTQKLPGCSLVEVNGLVYEFFVSDSSHPQIHDISGTIFGINKILQSDSFDSNILDHQEQWDGVQLIWIVMIFQISLPYDAHAELPVILCHRIYLL